MEENRIITLLFDRNENALKILEDNYSGNIKSLCYNLGLSVFDAEECLNDTLYNVWYSIPPAKPEFLSAFILKIARRKAIDKIRNQTALKRSINIDELYTELNECIPDKFSTEDAFDEKTLTDIINMWLETLKLSDKQIFVNRYFYCKSVTDISIENKLSKSNVTTKLHRLRKELQKTLEKEGVVYE